MTIHTIILPPTKKAARLFHTRSTSFNTWPSLSVLKAVNLYNECKFYESHLVYARLTEKTEKSSTCSIRLNCFNLEYLQVEWMVFKEWLPFKGSCIYSRKPTSHNMLCQW